ncbi:MAG: hypothetical protein IT429_02500 [Gemmataceae bacterium]|nr:hypothetical protein [Gemmataceae bacterium]
MVPKSASSSTTPAATRNSAASAWDRFWFTPADPTVLGAIRICCGLVTFYTFLVYTFDLPALLGEHAWLDLEARQRLYREQPIAVLPLDWQQVIETPAPGQAEEAHIKAYRDRWGVDPRVLAGMGQPAWSIWFHVTDPAAMMAIQVAFVVVSFLFLIGFCTRVTAVLTWMAAVCHAQRATAALFGVDWIMLVLLLYLAIGPSGAALSVDRRLARWWAGARPRVIGRWRAFWDRLLRRQPAAAPIAFGPTPPAAPAPSVSANVAIRLLQVHLCILYTSAGLSKLLGTSWWTGYAVWETIANFEFAPMQHGWYMAVLHGLAANRLVYEVAMTTAAGFTLFFEISYVFLVWRPRTRGLVLGMAILLHGLIGLFMGLKTFALLMLAMNLAFVPPETMHRLLRRLTRGRYGPPEPAPAATVVGKPALTV